MSLLSKGIRKSLDMDIASNNSQSAHLESQKAGENAEKNKNKNSGDSQNTCYWYDALLLSLHLYPKLSIFIPM